MYKCQMNLFPACQS